MLLRMSITPALAGSEHPQESRIETPRLILRRWRQHDPSEARSLFRYASDPMIGPACGWPVHRSIDESARVIASAYTAPENYAITLRGSDEPVGCIELRPLKQHAVPLITGVLDAHRLYEGVPEDWIRGLLGRSRRSQEFGYWIGRELWGRGFMTEALEALLGHAFQDLGTEVVWAEHTVENIGSGRVMEHCGMQPVLALPHQYEALIDEYHDMVVHVIDLHRWSVRQVDALNPDAFNPDTVNPDTFSPDTVDPVQRA